MRYTTFKDCPNIGKVWNDAKTVCYGIYGNVGALLDRGILRSINTGREMWIFMDASTGNNGECIPHPSKGSLKGWLSMHLVEGE